MDSIKGKTSASNEPICDKCKFDFDKNSGQKLFLSSLKALHIFFTSQNTLGKMRDICHQHTQLHQTILNSNKKMTKKNSMSEGEQRR